MTDPDWKTEEERIMAHFNANVHGCRRRARSEPRLLYFAGCHCITCEPTNEEGEPLKPTTAETRCPCAMNEGDGIPVSQFIAKWTERHG